jgi:CubicO group peptidase (beta-lactamase class C family)
MLKPIYLFILSLGLTFHSTQAAEDITIDQQTINRKITKALEKVGVVPGLAVAFYSAKGSYVQSFGVTDIETQEAVSNSTAFYIGSTTKSLTAVAMAALHAKGDINLDSSIASFAPEAPFPKNIKANQVSLRNLLAQSSGITNYPIGHRLAYTGEHTPTQLWKALSYTGSNIENLLGSFAYSNYNYNILTILTDQKLNRYWKDILAQDIFAKAGMTRSTAYMSKARIEKWSIARPHILNAKGLKRIYLEKDDNTMHSAGGVIMSANDAVKWLELLVESGTVNDQQVIPNNAVLATQKRETVVGKTYLGFDNEYYGLGFYGGEYGQNNDLMLHHFGGFAGSTAHVSYIPNRNVGIAIFANNDDIGRPFSAMISHYLYSLYLNNPKAESNFKDNLGRIIKFIKLSKKSLKKSEKQMAKRQYQLSQPLQTYAGTYTSDLFGTIEITTDQDNLSLSSGNILSKSTPYPQQDSIRVELTPGEGEIMAFKLNRDNKAESLTVSGIQYTKLE